MHAGRLPGTSPFEHELRGARARSDLLVDRPRESRRHFGKRHFVEAPVPAHYQFVGGELVEHEGHQHGVVAVLGLLAASANVPRNDDALTGFGPAPDGEVPIMAFVDMRGPALRLGLPRLEI